jgi:hypothetical protein
MPERFPAAPSSAFAPQHVGLVTHGFDAISILPKRAGERLRRLQRLAADRHALLPQWEDRQSATTARTMAESRLKRLTAHPSDDGFNLKDDDPRVKAAQRDLDARTEDRDRIEALYAQRAAQWQASSRIVNELEGWLRNDLPGGTILQAVETEPPKLLKGETLIDAIERLRRRGRELRADRHRVQSAPYPASFAKERMRQQVDEIAARGAISVSALVEHEGGRLGIPVTHLRVSVSGETRPSVGFAEAPDTFGMLAFLHKAALIAALDREIDSESEDEAALSLEARTEQTQTINGDLLSVERDEAWLVWAAMDAGMSIEHRFDIDPSALLGVECIVAPRGTMTVPDHVVDALS